jgi:hypothetical protein
VLVRQKTSATMWGARKHLRRVTHGSMMWGTPQGESTLFLLQSVHVFQLLGRYMWHSGAEQYCTAVTAHHSSKKHSVL